MQDKYRRSTFRVCEAKYEGPLLDERLYRRSSVELYPRLPFQVCEAKYKGLLLMRDDEGPQWSYTQDSHLILVLHRVRPYQGLSSVMHKYQVKPRSRLV